MAESKSTAETVVLRLEDQVSSAADAAEGALGRLERAITRDQNQLLRLEDEARRAQAALKAITGGGEKGDVVDISAYRKAQGAVQAMSDKIAAQKDKIGGGQEKLAALVTGAEKKKAAEIAKTAKVQENAATKIAKTGEAAKKTALSFRTITKEANLLGGEAGALTARVADVAHILTKLGPEVAGAVIAMVALFSVITIGIGTFVKAISAANEYRDSVLDLSAAGVTLWNSQRSSMYQSTKLNAVIDEVAAHSAMAREEIVGFAREAKNSLFFGQQIFQGKELASVVKTMATVAAGGSKALASQYLEQARTAKFLGVSLEALNKRMELKFGAVAEARLLSLDVQAKKLKEDIAYIFSGADIEPFLKGLQSILSLFGRGTETATAMRNAVTAFTEWAIGGFLDLAIAVVNTMIWFKKHEAITSGMMAIVKALGVVLAVVATILLGPLLLGIVGCVVAWTVLGALLYGFWAIIKGTGRVLGDMAFLLVSGLKEIGTKLGDLVFKWVQMGKDLIGGLVDGIKKSGIAVWEALRDTVMGAVDKVKGLLGIHSPSLYFERQIGWQMGAGAARGIERSGTLVQEAANDSFVPEAPTVAPTFKPAAGASSATVAPAQGASHEVNFHGCNFGDNSEASLRKTILSILEGEALDGGLAEAS